MEKTTATLLAEIEDVTAKLAATSREWTPTRAKHYTANLTASMVAAGVPQAKAGPAAEQLHRHLKGLADALSEAWAEASRAGDYADEVKKLADSRGAYGLTFQTYGH